MNTNKSKDMTVLILFCVIALCCLTNLVSTICHSLGIRIFASSGIFYLKLDPTYNFQLMLYGSVNIVLIQIIRVIYIGSIIGGIVGCIINNKIISIISTIVLDVFCIIAVIQYVTKFGFKDCFFDIALSPELIIIIPCLILITIRIGRNKKPIQNNMTQLEPANQMPAMQNPTTSMSSADSIEEIKKLKSLLDMGVITKEEFEEQKRKIL